MSTGGNAQWAGRCERQAVGLFYTSADPKPMPLCTQHKKIWATGQELPGGLANYQPHEAERQDVPMPVSSLDEKFMAEKTVTPLEAVRRLLEKTLAYLRKDGVEEAMPHEFHVALGVAKTGLVTTEVRRVLKLDEE